MIRLIHKNSPALNTTAFTMQFDLVGAALLADACKQACAGGEVALELERLQLGARVNITSGTLVIRKGNDVAKRSEKKCLILELDTEVLEYGAEKCSEAVECGCFEPAEFSRIRLGNEKGYRDLYCEVVE